MLEKIDKILIDEANKIEAWYKQKVSLFGSSLYSSIDLRYSGEKLVPVDTNVFPAGFNNVSQISLDLAKEKFKNFLHNSNLNPKKILLIGEGHDRNIFYRQNLNNIKFIIEDTDISVLIDNGNLELSSKDGYLIAEDEQFIPDLIILNNDLSGGVLDYLQNIKQTIIPNVELGWYKRRKSKYFEAYNSLLEELEREFSIPSFYLKTEHDVCLNVDFKNGEGFDELEVKLKLLFEKIHEKYDMYKIKQKPYIVIKSDFGTYGMGIMVLYNANDIHKINKKIRNKMSVVKSNVANNQVILQEGVETIDQIEGAAAEPMLYMVNNELVEFMYRVNEKKSGSDNLNSSGMTIINGQFSDHYLKYKNLCEFIAKIASLAISLELTTYKF